jgi:hypothetical protein
MYIDDTTQTCTQSTRTCDCHLVENREERERERERKERSERERERKERRENSREKVATDREPHHNFQHKPLWDCKSGSDNSTGNSAGEIGDEPSLLSYMSVQIFSMFSQFTMRPSSMG